MVKLLLKILQNSLENTFVLVPFLVSDWRWFSVDFANFLPRPFSQNTSGRLSFDIFNEKKKDKQTAIKERRI